MRKLGKRITGAVLAATMLVFGSDMTVLATGNGIVLEDAAIVEDDTDIIDESDINDENDIIDDTDINDENDIIDEDDISDDSEAENPAEDDFINEENSENPLSNEDSDADIILEEETVCEENLEGKKSKKDDHIDCSNIKTPGLTLIKTADEIEGPKKNPRNTDAYLWDCIYFGSYIQTDTDKDGKFDDEKKEPIKWRVLSKDENNRALIVSDKVLDAYIYNIYYFALGTEHATFGSDEEDIYNAPWNESILRSWLNGYGSNENLAEMDFSSDNFKNEAFSSKEQKAIIEVTNTGNYLNDDDNKYDSTEGIFLLSTDEITNSSYGFVSQSERKGQYTDYSVRSTIPVRDIEWDNYGKSYWLRTGERYVDNTEGALEQECGMMIDSVGDVSVGYYFNMSEGHAKGIRPAMYIDLNEDVWSYAAPISSDGMEYKEVTVHFDPQGGVIPFYSVKYSVFAEDYDYDSFPEPTGKNGFYFLGWKHPGYQYINFPFSTEDDVTFTAEWIIDAGVYVTFDFNDGVTQDFRYIFRYNAVITIADCYNLLISERDDKDRFLGWYSEPSGGERVDGTLHITHSVTFYAHWDTSEIDDRDIDNYQPGEMWFSDISEVEYTGQKIKPEMRVYRGLKKLKKGIDYTLEYSNNIDVGNELDDTNAPTITVRGKGNYEGCEKVFFIIAPRALSDENGRVAEDFSIPEMQISSSDSIQRPVPTVKFKKTTLKPGTDFEYAYFAINSDGEVSEEPLDGVKDNGQYIVRISGKGNYAGTCDVNLFVSDGINAAEFTVSKIPTQKYNFEGSHEVIPTFTVKYGSKLLTNGEDYSVNFYDNSQVGVAKAVITGLERNGYTGTKTVTFKIEAEQLGKIAVNGIENVTYDGNLQEFENIDVYKDEHKLTENVDYTISYKNNTNVGKASVIITGIGGYNGKVQKSFSILPLNILEEDTKEEGLIYCDLDESVPYAKGGAENFNYMSFCYNGIWRYLVPGKDYTVKYSNNTKVNNGEGSKVPTVTLKGKGNFTGTIKRTFSITPQDLSELIANAEDRSYKNKTNNYKSKITLVDLNGRKLSAGKDYDKKYSYCYACDTLVTNGKNTNVRRYAGEKINSKDILQSNTYISVVLKAKGKNYTGDIGVSYRITPANIADADVKISSFEYTGTEIRPSYSDITVTADGAELVRFSPANKETDNMYSIVSYSNNVKVGTATLKIKGHRNYSGVKTVKFKIRKKSIVWWNKE